MHSPSPHPGSATGGTKRKKDHLAREGLPVFGHDYDLERWSTGARDTSNNLIWHTELPSNNDWASIRIVTMNFDPDGEGDFRNYHISPDRPLDVYGMEGEDHYDLDDLALQAFLSYGFEF